MRDESDALTKENYNDADVSGRGDKKQQNEYGGTISLIAKVYSIWGLPCALRYILKISESISFYRAMEKQKTKNQRGTSGVCQQQSAFPFIVHFKEFHR